MPDMFLVWDKKAKAMLGPLFPARSDGEAVRVFEGIVKNPETLPHQYPDDFELWYLFELREGLAEPVFVGAGADGSMRVVKTAREVIENAR